MVRKILLTFFVSISLSLGQTSSNSFTVAFWGDSRTNRENAMEEIVGYTLAEQGKTIDVQWQNGDFTQGGSEGNWADSWNIKNVRESVVKDYFYMCTSNHDNEATPYNNNMGDILPSNGKNVLYYHKKFELPSSERDIHLFSIDLYMSPIPEQNTYFKDIIDNQTKPEDWIAVLYHAPTYADITYKNGYGHADSRGKNLLELLDMFKTAGADFVLNGHSHQYRRTRLLDADGTVIENWDQGVGVKVITQSESNGIMHIVNGRGGVFSSSSSGDTSSKQAFAPTFENHYVGLVTLMKFTDNVFDLRTIEIGDDYKEQKEIDSFEWIRGVPMPTSVPIQNKWNHKNPLIASTNPITGFVEIEAIASGIISIYDLVGNKITSMDVKQGQKLIWDKDKDPNIKQGIFLIRGIFNGGVSKAMVTYID